MSGVKYFVVISYCALLYHMAVLWYHIAYVWFPLLVCAVVGLLHVCSNVALLHVVRVVACCVCC